MVGAACGDRRDALNEGLEVVPMARVWKRHPLNFDIFFDNILFKESNRSD